MFMICCLLFSLCTCLPLHCCGSQLLFYPVFIMILQNKVTKYRLLHFYLPSIFQFTSHLTLFSSLCPYSVSSKNRHPSETSKLFPLGTAFHNFKITFPKKNKKKTVCKSDALALSSCLVINGDGESMSTAHNVSLTYV